MNYNQVQEGKRVMRALNDYIREETLKTIEASRARAQQDLKAATERYLEYAEQYRTHNSNKLDEELAEYTRVQEEERDRLNEEANDAFIETVKEKLPDEQTVAAIRAAGSNEEQTNNLIDIYESTPGLPVRALNALYPSKRITQESGWDRFVNSVQKGWHYFAKWFREVGWKLLTQIALDCLIAFIPGIGSMLGMLLSEGVGAVLDIIDYAKTGAERVALQRAINEGKSRGIDNWDEMFMWRSLIIILMVSVADVEGLTIDGNQLKALMATRPDFMRYMQDNEFVKDMWRCESKALELLCGEDPTTHEPDFQLYPENVDECRAAALEVLSDGRMRGFIASIPSNLKPFKNILK